MIPCCCCCSSEQSADCALLVASRMELAREAALVGMGAGSVRGYSEMLRGNSPFKSPGYDH